MVIKITGFILDLDSFPGPSQNGLGMRIYTGACKHRYAWVSTDMLESDWLVWNIWQDNRWGRGYTLPRDHTLCIQGLVLFLSVLLLAVLDNQLILLDSNFSRFSWQRLCWSFSKFWNQCSCRLALKPWWVVSIFCENLEWFADGKIVHTNIHITCYQSGY